MTSWRSVHQDHHGIFQINIKFPAYGIASFISSNVYFQPPIENAAMVEKTHSKGNIILSI